jgi:hypothetical protein
MVNKGSAVPFYFIDDENAAKLQCSMMMVLRDDYVKILMSFFFLREGAVNVARFIYLL